ncbi:MAG TPA: indolepyruvate ferredoxin oxidoreductase family protein, partial [Candidatus Accumulibacter sp.]|nr:indolepyruvate ferredoxin oxidoreductase family protein [Accumulibacter sp.]HCN66674.1 indolepyruvate ferredoxin oxidoreductase family protein [Accumulibacter sp.]
NRQAFLWGRRAAHDPDSVRRLTIPASEPAAHRLAASLDETISRRIAALTDYQDARYAERYRRLVERVRASELPLRSTGLSEAVARSYFKLLAVKDEYEVARLHADPAFRQQLAEQFEGDFRIRFHLAPPLLAKADPATGRVGKRSYGPWMMRVLRALSALKGVRGTAFDPFAGSEERKTERQLLADYEADIELLLARLDATTLATAIELAALPEEVRGFGHVKAASVQRMRPRREALRALLLPAAAAATTAS